MKEGFCVPFPLALEEKNAGTLVPGQKGEGGALARK